jgi:hypothetical protein
MANRVRDDWKAPDEFANLHSVRFMKVPGDTVDSTVLFIDRKTGPSTEGSMDGSPIPSMIGFVPMDYALFWTASLREEWVTSQMRPTALHHGRVTATIKIWTWMIVLKKPLSHGWR